MEKDVMIKYRSTIKSKNSKGGDRLQLYLSTEDATALVDAVTSELSKGGEKGVKLDIHTNEKTSDDGRKFLSSFGFVKAVGDGARPAASAPKKFAPKTPVGGNAKQVG